jgi:hypothetical protein
MFPLDPIQPGTTGIRKTRGKVAMEVNGAMGEKA